MREREERRVINEMRRRTTDEVVSLEDETLVEKFRNVASSCDSPQIEIECIF